MPSELHPVTMRATGRGISAGIGKLGAVLGVFLFPVPLTFLGLRATALLTAAVSVLGLALTLVPPRAGRAQPGRPGHQRVTRAPRRCGGPIRHPLPVSWRGAYGGGVALLRGGKLCMRCVR
jgi:hypothetical protein